MPPKMTAPLGQAPQTPPATFDEGGAKPSGVHPGDPRITEGYAPGIVAAVVGLHMAYYAPAWGFGRAFETKVARELAAFLDRYDPSRDLILAARNADGQVLASVSLDGATPGSKDAHLRWFIVGAAARGTGLGRALLRRALTFCDARQVTRSYLTTFAGLEAARHLYEQEGFVLVSTSAVDQWNGGVREQRFERPHA